MTKNAIEPLGIVLQLSPADNPSPLPGLGYTVLTKSLWEGQQTVRAPETVAKAVRLAIFDVTHPRTVDAQQAWTGIQINPGPLAAPRAAGGLLLNMMSVPTEHENEFNDWYDSEHLTRIAEVPGVLGARRFRMTNGPLDYAAVYHLADISLLGTARWAEAATTDWTRRIQSLRSAGARYVFDRPLRA